MSVTMRIDLQEFLRRLDRDLWAAGQKNKLEGIVLHVVYPGGAVRQRQLIAQCRWDENRYDYVSALNQSERGTWNIVGNFWDVVNVSRRRYPTGLKISILIHRRGR